MLITQNESEAIKMDVRQKRNKVLGERVVKALESRNMDAYYAETKEEAVQKAADVKITGAEYDTGKLSYQKVNQKLITGNVISSNKSGNTKAEKEMKEQLRRHLFMAEVSSVRVSTTPLRVSAKIKTRSAVVAGDFLSMFGICLFEYEGNDQAQGDFEIDQIRRWNALEGAMD